MATKVRELDQLEFGLMLQVHYLGDHWWHCATNKVSHSYYNCISATNKEGKYPIMKALELSVIVVYFQQGQQLKCNFMHTRSSVWVMNVLSSAGVYELLPWQ